MSEIYVGTLQPALLGYLMEGPKHAYQLNQEFKQGLGKVWFLGQSLLYAQLKQLAEMGLLEVEIISQPNRPARKVFNLTPEGKEAFTTWIHKPVEHIRNIRLEFLVRLFFFRKLGLPGLEDLARRQKSILETQISDLISSGTDTEDEYWRMVFEFRRGQTEAVINWLDFCINFK